VRQSRNTSFNVRTEAKNHLANSQALPQGSWKVSVNDMVKSSKKTNDEWGIAGYNYSSFNAHLDKPTVFSIAKETPGKPPRDYISML